MTDDGERGQPASESQGKRLRAGMTRRSHNQARILRQDPENRLRNHLNLAVFAVAVFSSRLRCLLVSPLIACLLLGKPPRDVDKEWGPVACLQDKLQEKRM